MLILLLYFVLWVAGATAAYFWIAPVAVIWYALLTLAALAVYVWFVNRKRNGERV